MQETRCWTYFSTSELLDWPMCGVCYSKTTSESSSIQTSGSQCRIDASQDRLCFLEHPHLFVLFCISSVDQSTVWGHPFHHVAKPIMRLRNRLTILKKNVWLEPWLNDTHLWWVGALMMFIANIIKLRKHKGMLK